MNFICLESFYYRPVWHLDNLYEYGYSGAEESHEFKDFIMKKFVVNIQNRHDVKMFIIKNHEIKLQSQKSLRLKPGIMS